MHLNSKVSYGSTVVQKNIYLRFEALKMKSISVLVQYEIKLTRQEILVLI